MGSHTSPQQDQLIMTTGLGLDLLILCLTLFKMNMDFTLLVFAALVAGWITGIFAIKGYKTRKPRKKLILFLFLHLLPLAIFLILDR